MTDIQVFSKSLNVTWIKKYLDERNQGKWKYFFDLELERHGGSIVLTSNLNKKDTIENLKIKNCFIKETLLIWAEVNFDEHIMSEKQFLEQILWHNSLVRIDNYPIFYREWFDRGVTKVKHLKDASNNFLSLAEMRRKYNLNICPLKYYGLLSTLKSLRNTYKNNYTNNCDYESFVAKLTKCQSANRLVYTNLISTKHLSHNQQKWLKDCQLDDVDSINWRDAYQLASKYTKSTRILEFQFKFLHRRIATNDFLTKIGVRDNPNCSFCNGEQEKLFHLFWSCPKVASFWHDLTVRLTFLHITPEHYIIDPLVALGLKPDFSKNYQQINFSCLLARNYIWMSKRKETAPKVEGFLQYLKSIYNMEANAECAHSKKWEFLNTF